jgi:hypothetical protein
MAKKKPQKESVFKEAWNNMSEDFNGLLPEKFQGKKDKKKFVLWLFILEIVVFGAIGSLVYRWWTG